MSSAKLALAALVFVLAACGGGDEADMSADSAQAAAAAGAAASTAPAASGGEVEVTQDQLKTAPEQFVGRTVHVTNQKVAANVGTQAFFLDVPQSPFLVKLDDALIQQGRALPAGTVNVTGLMRAMNDSTMRDWLSKGYIKAGDQILVEFATHYIEARTVEPGSPAP
jgi:hypothetical protein